MSSTGEVILYVPPTLIFFFGYGLWSARLAFYRIPRYWQARIVVSFRRCLREKKPSKLSDILPTVEKLEEMTVRAQKVRPVETPIRGDHRLPFAPNPV